MAKPDFYSPQNDVSIGAPMMQDQSSFRMPVAQAPQSQAYFGQHPVIIQGVQVSAQPYQATQQTQQPPQQNFEITRKNSEERKSGWKGLPIIVKFIIITILILVMLFLVLMIIAAIAHLAGGKLNSESQTQMTTTSETESSSDHASDNDPKSETGTDTATKPPKPTDTTRNSREIKNADLDKLAPGWVDRDDKTQRTVNDGDKKMDLKMFVLAINDDNFYGELLIAQWSVRAKTLSAFDIITTWALFPDPDAPGKLHGVACITDFNEWSGIAHQIWVKNYSGGDSYEEIIRGPWTDNTLWYQDYSEAKTESYKSSYPAGQAEQNCVAYREVSKDRKMSTQFKWGHTYDVQNGFSLKVWENEYYRKDGSVFTYTVTPADWA